MPGPPCRLAALELLPPHREGHEHVFGKLPGRGFSGWSKAKRQLDERLAEAGCDVPPWTLRDLRRSFVTHMADHAVAEPHIIEAVVNHISGHRAGVAGVYNRAAYVQARREALERWAAEVAKLIAA